MAGYLILMKNIDLSVLREGVSIPQSTCQLLFESLGFTLAHGQRKEIKLLLDGVEYEVTLVNQNFNKDRFPGRSDIVQIRYSPGSLIAQRLREIYTKTLATVREFQSSRIVGKKLHIPEQEREYLAIYSTPIANTLALDCITATEHQTASTELKKLDEWTAETASDVEAGIDIQPGIRKIRRISRAIGNNLKLLYDFRCQICGQPIGAKYGSSLIHAHHIDYFVTSLNNDASNILIVCPNHHAIIHDKNPLFDRTQKVYCYPNGLKEGLKLNKHL